MDYNQYRAVIELLGVHPALGPVGQGMNIEQNPHELAVFLSSISPVETVLELGTGYRAGLAHFMTENLKWQVTTVDQHLPQTPAPLALQIVLTTEEALPILKEASYDLVIIDADHTYEAIKRDYEWYADKGRIVMLHDIAGLRDCDGVAQFWREISRTKAGKLRKGFHEVIAEDEYRAGIGWINRGAR